MPAKHLALTAMMALLALSGCHNKQESDTPPAPLTQPGVLVTGGRMVLPAVPGHPAVAYFTLSNQSSASATITDVSIDGAAKAEMHTTTATSMEPLPRLELPSGASILFAPGGKHVMVFDLAAKVMVGGTVEITLSTADGKKITGQLQVEAADSAATLPMMHSGSMKM